MHPRVENCDGSVGSVNTKPSLATLRNMSSYMCCAIWRFDCGAERETLAYFSCEGSVAVGLVVVIAVVVISVPPLAFFDEREPALPREGAGARLIVQPSKFRLCHNCGQIR